MNKTTIAWTDFTSNPLRARNRGNDSVGWYCTKVSPGCAHCYAERINTGRFGNGIAYLPENAPKVEWALNYREFQAWQARRKHSKIFVCDMLDLFHDSITDEMIYDVFSWMAVAPQHTFQVLTKRAERMSQLVPVIRSHLPDRLEHVWLGVSVENQTMADRRIPCLLDTPAAVRFLSCEPLLSDINFHWSWVTSQQSLVSWSTVSNPTIDWVIVGGESGPGYRPMDLDWARSIRDQCQAAGVAYFFKQQSGLRPGTAPTLDGKEHKEFPR